MKEIPTAALTLLIEKGKSIEAIKPGFLAAAKEITLQEGYREKVCDIRSR
jgi:hypothetical protein